jgi:hypothetical protein
MLTQAQVLEAVRGGRNSETLDGRDYSRLVEFFPVSDWEAFGFKLKDGEVHDQKPWTEDEIRGQLAGDLAFGFEKALNQRGISAGLMYSVVKMWMWVLEETELASDGGGDYAQYGLPFFKAVAVKFGLPNPIGDDRGDEGKFAG